MQPFAGGEWSHDATTAGRQAGRAANGQSRKAQKIPLPPFQDEKCRTPRLRPAHVRRHENFLFQCGVLVRILEYGKNRRPTVWITIPKVESRLNTIKRKSCSFLIRKRIDLIIIYCFSFYLCSCFKCLGSMCRRKED